MRGEVDLKRIRKLSFPSKYCHFYRANDKRFLILCNYATSRSYSGHSGRSSENINYFYQQEEELKKYEGCGRVQ